MNKTESDKVPTLFVKLAAVQQEIEKFEKTADNPFYNSKYVPLEAIQERLLPLCKKYNLLIHHNTSETQTGRYVTTTYIRDLDSNEEFTSDFPLPQGDDKKEASSQQIGAAQSYGARYNLKQMFNLIIVGEDDDGNKASEVVLPKAAPKPPAPSLPPMRESGDDDEPYYPNTSHLPTCPECGKEMKLRTSKTGAQFFGCTGYPKCKGTMKVAEWEKLKSDVPY